MTSDYIKSLNNDLMKIESLKSIIKYIDKFLDFPKRGSLEINNKSAGLYVDNMQVMSLYGEETSYYIFLKFLENYKFDLIQNVLVLTKSLEERGVKL